MADALDDEWWLDGDQNNPATDEHDKQDVADDAPSVTKKTKASTKRKHVNQDEEAETTAEPDEPKKKKKKKRKKMQDVIAKESQQNLKNDALTTALKKHYEGKLSPVEWEEIALDVDKHFLYCNDMSHSPSSYLKMMVPKWKRMMLKSEPTPGAPLLIILASSALRVIELIKQIKEFKTEEAKVEKLFAKHIKLGEQMKTLQKRVVHIAVGTPNRILALLDNDALKITQLRFVILDWNWRDQKLRRLADIPETRTDTFQLLRKHIIPNAKDAKAKLGLL